VLVLEVAPGSAAEKAGLKAGDCIVQVDSTPVESVMDLHRALAMKAGASREITLTIVRDHQQQTVKAQIEGREPSGRQSGAAEAPPGMKDLDSLENEVRALTPSAAAEVRQAREFARQLASEGGELREEAEEAAREAREAQKQMLQHNEEWQRELKRLGPEIQQLQRDLQDLRSDSTTV
jgi:membrane-associated protease RseP (regulator of RpoE activity)